MYDYDDDEGGGRSPGRMAAIAIGVVAIAVLGWFFVRPRLSDDPADSAGTDVSIGATTTSGGSVGPAPGETTTTTDGGTETESTAADDPPASLVLPTTTLEETTTAAPTTAAPTTAAPAAAPYATLPDGSPQPVIATYDTNSIILEGVVPDEAAKQRLQDLAIANAKPGQADSVTNNVAINPAVPRNVGVRVVELTSARFPPGSAEVLPEHAVELDRVATVMEALPNITALVIGHADQRGDEQTNFALSEQRANSVRNYIASRGISPDRLSARAVGEADLLTLNDDEAALALNRRTEFVFYGLLLG